MSAWSHLPNAASIDRIVEDMRDRPRVWDAANGARAWTKDWNAARSAAHTESRKMNRNEARIEARNASYNSSRNASWGLAWDAIEALIAWDHAGSYLDLPIDQIKVLAALGDNIAILILPAAIALESQREMA